MKVLVIGSGGREHALVWKISQSPLVEKIYAAPGNAGISQLAECVDIPATDIISLRNFAFRHKIDLTVVGPEGPLEAGIVDLFQADRLPIFGPTQVAAQLETSKSFCKELLRKNGVPTASYRIFTAFREAQKYLKECAQKNLFPVVIKADGLAAGKGVVVAKELPEALQRLSDLMEKKILGKSGEKVIIEEYLTGEEVSVISITDGRTLVVLEPAQDYKRAFDYDQGPNTGGMGAYSPVPFVSPQLLQEIIQQILIPTLHGMRKLGITYQGVLYAGLILTPTGPKVLEYNCRFGDPETQPLMMRLKSDLVELLLATIEARLEKVSPPEWLSETALCVVLASNGYPGKYETGFPITGLDKVSRLEGVQVFHAGTAFKDNTIITSGGRVLGVTGLGKDLNQAREKVYQAVQQISFAGAFYRKDIGQKKLPPN